MVIYIKPVKKATLSQQRAILVRDVAEVVAQAEMAEKVKAIELKTIEADGRKKKNYLISVTDIIKKINEAFPDCTVCNVGVQDTWVQYAAQKSRDNAVLKWAKVVFVVVVLLVGSATAIMSFHSDAQMPAVFENYFRLLYGEKRENPRIIVIPYSIGLAVGIVAFYNHFMGKKLTDDPTPIEVEMEQYENQVTETMVDLMNLQQDDGA